MERLGSVVGQCWVDPSNSKLRPRQWCLVSGLWLLSVVGQALSIRWPGVDQFLVSVWSVVGQCLASCLSAVGHFFRSAVLFTRSMLVGFWSLVGCQFFFASCQSAFGQLLITRW